MHIAHAYSACKRIGPRVNDTVRVPASAQGYRIGSRSKFVLLSVSCALDGIRIQYRVALPRFAPSRALTDAGSEADTNFYTQWWLSRALFPRMCLRNTWEKPPNDPSENPRNSGAADVVGFISDLDFSPSGRLLAASSTSNAVYVFDPNRGSLVRLFDKPHDDSVSKVRFVNDHQFVSGSADGVVGYWDMRFPSKALNHLRGHSKLIRHLNYLAESSTLVTGSLDGDVRRWHLPTFALDKDDPLVRD